MGLFVPCCSGLHLLGVSKYQCEAQGLLLPGVWVEVALLQGSQPVLGSSTSSARLGKGSWAFSTLSSAVLPSLGQPRCLLLKGHAGAAEWVLDAVLFH